MPPSPASRTQTVWIALSPLLFTFLWSTGFVGAKFGLPYAEPLTYLLLRFVLAAALLVPIALMLKISWPKRHEIKHVALVGLLVQGVYLGGVFIAIHNGVQAGVAALIVSAQPILTAALAGPMLGEKVTRRQWLGLLFGLAGVAAVIAEKIDTASADAAWATLYAVASLLAITLGTLYQKKYCHGVDVVGGNCVQFVTVIFAFGLGALLFETNVVHWTGEFVFALAWQSIILSIGATTLLYVMIKRGAASQVASLFYLVPPFTAILAWLMFGETFGISAIIGMVLVAIGILLIRTEGALGGRRRPA
ncbi:DMT family transporter [Oceanibaculum nanhaiense]|jgi:drug/metabolite transporter (DMT)-like permease|uniref:DMT family transporter n=1 Tax=Oceanibaculum nanhaiense TaxID=1909734 RepID=UPI0025A4B007|nr:DMT family transporter [Oceanibaculum nanhaiense]MDM7946213.1 DMT family transporter [Oceanibaculum nanhaiense]